MSEFQYYEFLASLTSAQLALAKFLEVDPDLLAGAGMGNPTAPNMDVSSQEMDHWLETLPIDNSSKREFL
jgi:hypothetical protein